jgi:hypothetical protein
MLQEMRRRRVDFEGILHAFAVAGEIALLTAATIAVVGIGTHLLVPYYGTTLRFLVAVLVVMAPYAELTESRARRVRHIPIDERLGFRPRNA